MASTDENFSISREHFMTDLQLFQSFDTVLNSEDPEFIEIQDQKFNIMLQNGAKPDLGNCINKNHNFGQNSIYSRIRLLDKNSPNFLTHLKNLGLEFIEGKRCSVAWEVFIEGTHWGTIPPIVSG